MILWQRSASGTPAGLFADDAYTQAAANRAVWRYIIGIRSMWKTDLSLVSYEYKLTCDGVSMEDDGSITFILRENSMQNFAAYPDVNSKQYGILHYFTIKDTEDGLRITRHFQRDTVYWTIMGPYFRQNAASPSEAERYFTARKDEILDQAKTNVGMRATQGSQRNDIGYDHEYDRVAAVAYAGEWVGKRNEDWPDYSGNGGNCQNFASQCLTAGGIPMDINGSVVWKWYGATPNDGARAAGRSYSWAGVNEFFSYAESNSGFGLVAEADAPYYSGQAGDLLTLGFSDDWRHVVFITDVIRDENGNAVDYLISSNTADQKNFPASALFLYSADTDTYLRLE